VNRITTALATATLIVVGVWVMAGGLNGVATAHAEFGQSAITAGTTATVTLYVPQEYGPDYFNVQVQVRIPNGWQAVGANDNILTFSNPGGLGEEFPITVTAPSSPVSASAFVVRQTYNTTPQGSGDGGAFCDPPTNRVVCWYYSATLTALATPSSAPAPTPPTPTPTPSSGGTSGGPAIPPEVSAQGTLSANEPGGTDPDPAERSTLESLAPESNTTPTELAAGVATSDESSSGASALPFVFLAIGVVFAAACGTVVIRRNKTSSTPEKGDI
jgi:hypothetical protein